MKRIRLQVALLPWVQLGSAPLASTKPNEAPLKPWLHVCTAKISLQDLADQIVEKFAKIYVGLGPLTIQHLESDYGEILDLTDNVGDVFDDRAPSGESRTSIVRVSCFAPDGLQLQTSSSFDSVVPESSARPRKRPFEQSSQGFLLNSSLTIPTTESRNSQRSSVTLGRDTKRQKRDPSGNLQVPESVQGGPQNQEIEGSLMQVFDSQKDQSISQHYFTSGEAFSACRPSPQNAVCRTSDATTQTRPHSASVDLVAVQPPSSRIEPGLPNSPSIAAAFTRKGQHRISQQPSGADSSHSSPTSASKVRESSELNPQPNPTNDSVSQDQSTHDSEESHPSADKTQSDGEPHILKAKAFAEQLASRQKIPGDLSRIQSFLDEASEASRSSAIGSVGGYESRKAQKARIYEAEAKRAKSLDGKCAAEKFLARQQAESEIILEPLLERSAKRWPRASTPGFLVVNASKSTREGSASNEHREQTPRAAYQKAPSTEILGPSKLSAEGIKKKKNRNLKVHSEDTDGSSTVSSLDLGSNLHSNSLNGSMAKQGLRRPSPRPSINESIPSVKPLHQSNEIERSSGPGAYYTADSQCMAKEKNMARSLRLHDSETESLRSISDISTISKSAPASQATLPSPSLTVKVARQIPPISPISKRPKDLTVTPHNEVGEGKELTLNPRWPITPPSTKDAEVENTAQPQITSKTGGPRTLVEPVYTSIIGPGTVLGKPNLSNDKSRASDLSGIYPKFTCISSSDEPSPSRAKATPVASKKNAKQADPAEDNEGDSDSDTDVGSDLGKEGWGAGMKGLQKLAAMRRKNSSQKREIGYLVI